MDDRMVKYLEDIRQAIEEIETASDARSREFEVSSAHIKKGNN